MKAVYLDDDITSLSVPIAPFEAIILEAAMKEDAPGWKRVIHEELSSLLKIQTFAIKKGRVLQGRRLLLTCLVLRKKYNTSGEVNRLKARLYIRSNR